MLPMLMGNALLFVLSIAVMFILSPVLALISLAVGPALLVLSIASRRRLFPASWDAQQKAGEVAGVVEGAVTGVRVVKGFGQEQQEIDRLDGVSQILYAARVRAVRLMARFSPALGAIPALGQVGVLALGGWMAIKGSITLGTFLAFASYLAQMVNPVRALTNLITIGQEARASVIRVFEVIDSRPVITEQPGRPGPAAGQQATSSLTTCTSATCHPSQSCAACRCECSRARRSPSSAPRARASRRSRSCSPGSTTCGRARSGSAGMTSAT